MTLMQPSWRNIKAGLRNQLAETNMTPSDAFWRNFRSRAPVREQTERAAVPALFAVPRWAVATACAMLVIAFSGILLFRETESRKMSSLKSLDVLAAHEAVLMETDEESRSTVLWIVNMEVDSENGGSI